MTVSIIPAVAFNRLSAAEQLKALTSRKPVDHKARTLAATVHNIFAAKERHDSSFAAMVSKPRTLTSTTTQDCCWLNDKSTWACR